LRYTPHASIDDARFLWKTTFYDLVLLEARENFREAMAISQRIREQKPRQRIAFFVGPPEYLVELAAGFPADRAQLKSTAFTGLGKLVGEDAVPEQWAETVQKLLAS